jgi:hypothetical protein
MRVGPNSNGPNTTNHRTTSQQKRDQPTLDRFRRIDVSTGRSGLSSQEVLCSYRGVCRMAVCRGQARLLVDPSLGAATGMVIKMECCNVVEKGTMRV